MNKCRLIGHVQNIQTQMGTRQDGGQWTKYTFTLASVLGKTPNNINCYTWHSNLGKSLVNGQQIELTAYWPVNREYIGKDGLQKSFLSIEVVEIANLSQSTNNVVQQQVAQAVENSQFDTKQAVAQIEQEEESTDDVFAELEKITSEPVVKCTWTFLAEDSEQAIEFGKRLSISGYTPQSVRQKIKGIDVIQIVAEMKESISNSYNTIYNVYKDNKLSQAKPKPVNPQDGIKDAFGNVYSKSQVAQTINQINQDVQSKLIKGDVEIDLGKHTFSVDPSTGEVNAKKQ